MPKKPQITAETINEWYHGDQARGQLFPRNFLFDKISNFITKNNIYEDDFLEVLKNVDVRDIKGQVFAKMDFSPLPQFLRGKSLNSHQFGILIKKSIPEGRMPTTFEGLDLTSVDFRELGPDISISGITFRNCNMENVDLSTCLSINNCQFVEKTNLKGANFSGQKLENIAFGEVDLSKANFSKVSFVNTKFQENAKLPKKENFKDSTMDYRSKEQSSALRDHLKGKESDILGSPSTGRRDR